MKGTPIAERTQGEQNRQISEAVERERPRLRNFIRRRVGNDSDVEDILQEVFFELVEAYRGTHPVELASAWFYRVARNRIIDLFRKKEPESLNDTITTEEGDELHLEDLLPSAEAGPDAAYARTVLLEQVEDALEELPDEQRTVFIAHEFEGRSFKQLADKTGLSVNTLISRKHYAVLHLRERLQDIYDDLKEE
jgi:RNA polymerase sigma factor (sigma-70 family)